MDDSAAKSSETSPVLVVQPHGGAIRRGNPGNKGGRNYPDRVRQRLAKIVGNRTAFVKDVIDGKCLQDAELPVAALLEHLHCETCGTTPTLAGKNGLVTVSAKVSPSLDNRLRAYELGARVGIPQVKEVTVEHVRERVRQTLEVIRAEVAPADAERVVAALKGIWA